MQIAFISDIHGNLVSLETILPEIRKASPDLIVCLGDTAAMGPDPGGVLDLLQDTGCLCILGNHDEELLSEQPVVDPKFSKTIREWVFWTFTLLTASQKDFLKTFSSSYQFDLGAAGKLLCCHGTPATNQDPILPFASGQELDAILDGVPTHWIAFGHTHIQTFRRHQQYTLFNPGSVGAPFLKLPFTGNPDYMPWAEYGLLTVQNKKISLQLHRVDLDVDSVIKSALSSAFPLKEEWIESWRQGQSMGS